jgi:hypothetical protein
MSSTFSSDDDSPGKVVGPLPSFDAEGAPVTPRDRMNALRASLMTALNETFGPHVAGFEVNDAIRLRTPADYLASVDAVPAEERVDSGLSDAVVAYVWGTGMSAVPGRHPADVPNPDVRARVEGIVRASDASADPAGGADLAAWHVRIAADAASTFPELSPEAARAIAQLLTWEWR